jgi:fatty-acyl-CoA synthase/long-chain acyl-CoA synthetase
MIIKSWHDIVRIEEAPIADSCSTYKYLREGAAINPVALAMSFFLRVEDHSKPARWTYAQLFADITRAANMFRRLGVQRDDVVAYILPNLPETHIALWGAETAGIAFAVNSLLEPSLIGELLREAQTRWVVTTGPDTEIWNRVEIAIAGLPDLQGVLAVDALMHLPGYTGKQTLPATLAGVQVLDFGAELAREDGSALSFAEPDPDDVASYFCTGGTTGLPKIALHLHRNEVANCMQITAVANQLFGPDRTLLCALPLFHVNAQLATGLAVFGKGGHVLLAPPAGYRAEDLIPRFWEIIETHQVTAFAAVPTVYSALLQVPRSERDLSCLTHALCGAAPLPMELFRDIESTFGIRLLEGYGLTESACVASLNPADGEARIGSIGFRLPWQPMRAMVVDSDGTFQREATVDEVGAICICGPNVFPGYLNPAHNNGVWFETAGVNDQKTRWFNTGDLGRQDADGYFWLTGRKKELIIRGGHNIDPKSIEEVLATHPAVAMCAVVGRPDSYAGEVPVVYVQLRTGTTAAEAELLDYAATHITERAAIPKAVHIVPALPLTAVGKIFKPTLQMAEVAMVVRAEATALGVALSEVHVEQDPKLGIVANYRLAEGDGEQLAAALGRHIFRSRLLA